jgi:hypothetical protein
MQIAHGHFLAFFVWWINPKSAKKIVVFEHKAEFSMRVGI